MPNRPIVDLSELVHKEVQAHMRPLIQVTMFEHEETRNEVKDLHNTLRRMNTINVHDVIQYAILLVLGLVMIFIRGC